MRKNVTLFKTLNKKTVGDLMYCFGDVKNPNPATVELLEEYILDYLEILLVKAYERANRRDPGATKILKEDLLYFIKENTKVMARVAYMLKIERDVANEKKKFNEMNAL